MDRLSLSNILLHQRELKMEQVTPTWTYSINELTPSESFFPSFLHLNAHTKLAFSTRQFILPVAFFHSVLTCITVSARQQVLIRTLVQAFSKSTQTIQRAECMYMIQMHGKMEKMAIDCRNNIPHNGTSV